MVEKMSGQYERTRSQEALPAAEFLQERLLARVTLSRHEETEYTGIGRDITDRGSARAAEKGDRITREKGAPLVIGTSPKERAIGTGESIQEGVFEAEPNSPEIRWITVPGLQATKYHDKEFPAELTKKYGLSQDVWTHAHYNDPEFYDNPDRVETNEDKRSRMYRELERLVSFLEKREIGEAVPHLVFVSHYEILTLLLDDVFGIKTFSTPNTPTFGEHVDIDLYHHDKGGNVPLRIQFREHKAEVLFDRSLRRLTAVPESR